MGHAVYYSVCGRLNVVSSGLQIFWLPKHRTSPGAAWWSSMSPPSVDSRHWIAMLEFAAKVKSRRGNPGSSPLHLIDGCRAFRFVIVIVTSSL